MVMMINYVEYALGLVNDPAYLGLKSDEDGLILIEIDLNPWTATSRPSPWMRFLTTI